MEVRGGQVQAFSVTPEELGVQRAPFESLRSWSPEQSAEIARHVLGGEHGPERSLTLLNAGAAIYTGGRASSIAEGVTKAAESIDEGAAREVLERYVERTRKLAPA
jgi:anthranilate phosphoribosyltransferase